jgi:hypothetical protein
MSKSTAARLENELPSGVSATTGWERFWFTPSDPATVGFIRLCTGFIVLYIHLVYSIDLMNTVGPDAWLSLATQNKTRIEQKWFSLPWDWSNEGIQVGESWPIFSPYYHVTTRPWIITVHTTVCVVMALFAIGLWTRVTSVLAWLGALFYVHRVPTMLFGMDAIMLILLFYLIIAPCGAAYSLDSWLLRRRARASGEEVPDSSSERYASATFAVRLMQIHFCIIYMASGMSKLQGATWWGGTAIWGTVANFAFAPMNWEPYQNFLYFLCRHRWLWELSMSSGVVFTLFMELGFPFLVWFPRFRWFMVTGSVLLHTGIGLLMGLATFSLLMLCLVLAFVPPASVRAFTAALGRKPADRSGSSRPATATRREAVGAATS